MSEANTNNSGGIDESDTDEGNERLWADLLEWALHEGYVVQGRSSDAYRVVETGFLGSGTEVRGYLKGMIAARNIDADEYPTWEQEGDVECKLTDTSHDSVRDNLVERMEAQRTAN